MGIKEDFKQLEEKCEHDYDIYKEKAADFEKEYNDVGKKFDVLIGTINAERLSFRKEIRALYDFLMLVGGSLRGEKRISVFDFADESPAPSMESNDIKKVENTNTFKKESIGWVLLVGFGFGAIGVATREFIRHNMNRATYENCLMAVETKKSEYERDLNKKRNMVSDLKDAVEIAKIYRSIIVTVKDTISEKIIPELDFIRSFLYADAIRELVLEGESLETDSIEPCNIAEYKGTKQDIHYQFIKNAFDFYRISTQFFKKPILTDILEDRVVTEQEKADFNEQVQLIKNQISSLEDMKVVK